MPLADRTDKFTILDPSDKFASVVHDIAGRPIEYVKPDASGIMPFEDKRFDLITCFGVLHHIPNVSFVIEQCARCLNDEGILLIREPIVSMGDWRKPRVGLTRLERGIPVKLLSQFILDAGLTIESLSWCVFPPINRLFARAGIPTFSKAWSTRIDSLFATLFSFNSTYYNIGLLSKIAPASAFYVVRKP